MNENGASILSRLKATTDAAIVRFCSQCAAARPHEICVVFGFDHDNWDRLYTAQIETLRLIVEEAKGSLDLQGLFDACCDMRRHNQNFHGYQSAAANEVSTLIRRIIYEERHLHNLLNGRAPRHSHESRLIRDSLKQLKPAFSGYSKTFYVLRDVAKALRGIKRAQCKTCGKRFNQEDGWRDNGDYTADDRWCEFVYPTCKGKPIQRWSCSRECNRKATKQLDKEIKWLKIARQRQTELRKYLKNTRAA